MSKDKILIRLSRAEGPIDFCYHDKRFNNFRDATSQLNTFNSTFPKSGNGYDKHDLLVTWLEDDSTLSLRIDKTQELILLKHYIIQYLKFLAGERQPAHLTKEEYDYWVKQYNFVEGAKIWMERINSLSD